MVRLTKAENSLYPVSPYDSLIHDLTASTMVFHWFPSKFYFHPANNTV